MRNQRKARNRAQALSSDAELSATRTPHPQYRCATPGHPNPELSTPPDALQIPDSQWPMGAVTFHMESGRPGYMGIALAPDGRIDHLSLYVQRGICEAQENCTKQVALSEARNGG